MHTSFTFQMGVNPNIAGCRNVNLKLTAVLDDSRHKRNKVFYLFMNFKGAFIFQLHDLIMNTIDMLPICPIFKTMWKKTTNENQVRLIVNSETSNLITIMRGVAQGN